MRKNIFQDSAESRQKEQKGLSGKATGQAPAQEPKTGRVQICVSMSAAEHDRLKAYAEDQGATVSGIVKKWIRENCH